MDLIHDYISGPIAGEHIDAPVMIGMGVVMLMAWPLIHQSTGGIDKRIVFIDLLVTAIVVLLAVFVPYGILFALMTSMVTAYTKHRIKQQIKNHAEVPREPGLGH
ncbi:hypothetical protein NBM05_04105 [Rothia sp. AR01]|uniref:Uncharacterized protein n=1 Tax=Rothia santali TaxID=2949643 RepID=A0A9X2KHS5_9MICC|nr:hypothetical protein [Rothia santali]MCP3425230.1 hypothetical protein [Rothia santali]